MMFFRPKVSRNALNGVEPSLQSAASLSEMSALLQQAVGIVEGLRSKCDSAERERDAALAEVALTKEMLAKLEASQEEKDQLFSGALQSAVRSREELEAYRLDSAEFEAAALERIELLQMELDDIEKTAALRWRSLDLKASIDARSDEAILDLLHLPDGSPLMLRQAA